MLDINKIFADVEAEVGFADPERAKLEPNLRVLDESLDETAKLTPSGLELLTRQTVECTRARLETIRWMRDEPSMAAEVVKDPIFMTGLPRSGTTFMQYIFDHDPGMRQLRMWERQPYPPQGADPESVKARVALAEERLDEKVRLMKNFKAIHLADKDGPDECHTILTQAYAQAGYLNYIEVPTYFDRFLDEFDLDESYRIHKRNLQFLQWRMPKQRWALKYPNHVVAMDSIMRVNPDAKFIMTHRDPVQTMGSACQATLSFRGAYSDNNDRKAIGKQMRHFYRRHIDGIMRFHPTPDGQSRVFNIDYYRFIREPQEVAAEVYAWLGMEMPQSVRQGIVDWHTSNPKGKRGKHEYTLADFGLDEDECRDFYSDYSREFGIASEKQGLSRAG